MRWKRSPFVVSMAVALCFEGRREVEENGEERKTTRKGSTKGYIADLSCTLSPVVAIPSRYSSWVI
jgi:hypothetical protein